MWWRKYHPDGMSVQPLCRFNANVTTLGNPATLDERTLRILIAEDHPMIRKRVRTVLEGHHRFDVYAEAADGAEAIKQAMRLKPDVVVLNITCQF